MSGRGRKAALSAGAVAIALTAAACGGGSSPSGRSTAPTGGGPLTVASSVAPPTLDLTSNPAAAIDEALDYNVYQHLVQLDPKGHIVPVLATAYSVSADGLTYTFTVRSGVTFSNGDPMTPADVVFSLQRAMAPNSTYPYKAVLGGVTSVAVSGTNQVVVTLSKPNNQFLYDLAAYSNGVVLDPKAVGTIATAPVGTGPYKFTGFVPNYSLSFTLNPSYWGPKPGVSSLVFRYFPNANAENSALQSGQVQVVDNLPNPQDVSQFKGNSAYKVIAGPTNGKIQMTINNSSGPLSHAKVRQAISYATDKQAILQAAGAGYGTVIGSDTVPGDPWYLPSLAQVYPYNPTKAKQLLTEAGYPSGFALTLTLPPYGYAQTAGPLIAAELNAVGIRTTIKNIQWPLWISQVFLHGDFQLTIVDHVEARDVGNYANCGYYWKYAQCSQVASMLSAAQAATSQSGMVSGYQQILTKITAAAVNDWLYNPDQITVAKANIVGLPTSGRTESFDLTHASIGGTVSAQAQAQGYSS
ncbi:MAG: ABC transporter substrate-binding protein [Actinomycetes bacterium]